VGVCVCVCLHVGVCMEKYPVYVQGKVPVDYIYVCVCMFARGCVHGKVPGKLGKGMQGKCRGE
jgi:hypothetical protein